MSVVWVNILMIYGIIGDIHSNGDALTAILAAMRQEHVDSVLCVGDIVGYAAEPGLCIDLIRESACAVVAGNHDYAVVGKFPVNYFNADAKSAVLWTAKQLSKGAMDYLRDLPLTERVSGITLAHGSLYRPEFFDYITTIIEAGLAFDQMDTPVCFYGHTHVPLGIFMSDGKISVCTGNEYDLSNAEKALINVGSVGQPRDCDVRASYALYDTEKKIVKIHRVIYNIHSATEKIYSAGLPKFNAQRLTGR